MRALATPQPPGRAELLPRYLYFSSLLKGRRVLEVGAVASTDGLSAHFLSKLALEVTAVDDAADAISRAQKTLGRPGLDFREGPVSKLKGKFDVILCADLTEAAMAEELAKLLARKGYLVAAVRDGAGLTLSGRAGPGASRTAEKTIAALSQTFESVAVVWQSPVLGYEISFEESESPAVEATLAAGVEPAYQLIIASAEPPALPISTLFRLSHDFVELADKGAFKALEAELHQLRVELVEAQATLHTGGGGAPIAAVDTDKHQAPAAHVKLLATAHEQMKQAAEQLKATNERLTRMKESLAAEEAARAAVEKELERLRESSTKERNELERQLLEAKQNTDKFTLETKAEREAWEKRFAEAEANAGRFGAAVRDQTKKLSETEDALQKAKARIVELEEEIALSKTMESRKVAEEQSKVEALEAKLIAAIAKEKELTELLATERAGAASVEREFAKIMRELREALEAKETLEKQIANEKLERARLERMRKA